VTQLRVTIGCDPTRLRIDDTALPLGPTHTTIVAALALFHPDPVDTADLCDLVWHGDPPETARSSLQNHLSRLRRRIPALLERGPDGYRFGEQVDVELDSVDHEPMSTSSTSTSFGSICPELADHDWIDQRRSELARQRRSADRSHVDVPLSTARPAPALSALRTAVEQDPFDERAWFRLAAVTAATIGRDAALAVADEATRALASCGLEPGRRLRDLERLVRDGERDLERLMTDRSRTERPAAQPAIDPGAADARAREVLELLDEEQPTHVRIHGPARSGRSTLVDLVARRARRAGVSVCTMLGTDFDGLALPVVGEWQQRRRRLLIIDDVDRLNEPSRASLTHLLADAGAADALPLVVVSTAIEPSSLPEPAAAAFVNVDVELSATHSFVRRADTSVPFDESSAERSVLDILAVSELAVHLADLRDVVPGAADAVITLSRSGWIRDRHGDDRWSLVDGDLRSSVSNALDASDLLQLHQRLAAVPFAADGEVVRARRRARHAVGCVQLDRVGAVDALEHAADQARELFDHHAAASFSARAATEAESIDPVRSLWADIAAARSLLAAGDIAGLDRLDSVVERSLDLGLPAPAAAATHSFCRLGPASTAGVIDERAARLVERVMPHVHDPVDRSLVGAAATMVHLLADDVEHCRQLFDRALEAADESGHDPVLAEVLFVAYLACAAPEDLELRERIAERLALVADRLERPDVRWEALHLRFSNQLQRGDPGFRASAELLAEAAEGSRETVRDWEMAYVRATMAHLDGRLADAEDEITASLELAGAVGTNRAMAVYGSVLLACRLDDDRVHELAPSIEALAADQPLVLAWQAPLALAGAVTGATEDAARAFDRLVGGTDRLPRDCTYTAALVMLGEAAARLGHPQRTARAVELLAPWSGRWAWTGTCSFGPIDLTLARLAESSGDRAAARRLGSSALASAAAMRSPVIADRAACLVLRQR
jgi:DNA-binding SARP family transcriptional activator